MRKLHVINLEKHNPGYKDRSNIWLRFHFSAMNDHGFSRLCEIDKWRFIHFIMLEIQTKGPIPLDIEYLKRQGFDLQSRRLESTIRQLTDSELVEIGEGTEWEQSRNSIGTEQEQESGDVDTKRVKKKSVTQSRVDKSRVEKNIYVCDNPPTRQEILNYKNLKSLVNVDVDKFISHYENADKGPWTMGNGKKLTDWKRAMGRWNGSNTVKSTSQQLIDRDRRGAF